MKVVGEWRSAAIDQPPHHKTHKRHALEKPPQAAYGCALLARALDGGVLQARQQGAGLVREAHARELRVERARLTALPVDHVGHLLTPRHQGQADKDKERPLEHGFFG